MSLIGSLEDLGLGDVLQIVSLARKSGVLSVRGEGGEGIIVLRDGSVCSAHLKGEPMDLREAIVGGRFLEAREFEVARQRAVGEKTGLEAALAAHTSMTVERIDLLRRDCVEAAVMAMFAWETGEFSFERSAEFSHEDLPLFLSSGISAQYLAMEGARIKDEALRARRESCREAGTGASDSLFPDLAEDSDPRAPSEGSSRPAPMAVEALALAAARRVDHDSADSSRNAFEASSEVEVAAASSAPLVVIDPDLVALEWMKRTLEGAFPRIHIFQRWDLGLAPIRQYLARAQHPVVILQPGAWGDFLSGTCSSADFVARLKAQQASLPVLWLREDEAPGANDFGPADGVVTRPSFQQLRNPLAVPRLRELASDLRRELAAILSPDTPQRSRRAGSGSGRREPLVGESRVRSNQVLPEDDGQF